MPDHIPTLADICGAIAEGHLSVASDGSTYQVNALELRRYFNQSQPSPHVPVAHILTSAYSDTNEWSCPNLCSTGR